MVRRLNRGDMDALRDAYDLYKHDLVTLAAALLGDRSAAEDAVHDVFARLAAMQGRIAIAGSLRAYLLCAVANAARSLLRDRCKAGHGPGPEGPEPVARDLGPDCAAIKGEQTLRVCAALQHLPYEQREAVLLRHFTDQPFKAIARAQGVTISTVQGRYRYGIEKLKAMLAGDL